ncbi:MAG: metal-dependent hydrolase [Acidobacteriota bacterium]
MDNLTHSLVAASLGRAGLSEKVPGGTLSLVAAANLADADAVSSFWGTLYYLAYHRGTSHSIVGTLAFGTVLTAILWLVGRWRGHPASPAQIGLAVFLAAATHPLLDLTNSYGLRPFLPFVDRWYYGDLIFIVDPYLWLVLGGAVFLTAKRGRLGKTVWAAGAILASLVLVLAAVGLGLWVPIGIWLAGVAVVLALKARRPVFPRRLAAGALGAVVVYWGFLALMHWLTLKEVYPQLQALYPGISHEAVSATPRPANPFEWDLFVDTPDYVAYARVSSSFSAQKVGFRRIARNQDDPAVTAAVSTCAGTVFTHFARFPVFQVARGKDRPSVTIEDIRFTRLDRSGRFGTVTIRLDSPGEIPCPWKGSRDRGVESSHGAERADPNGRDKPRPGPAGQAGSSSKTACACGPGATASAAPGSS